MQDHSDLVFAGGCLFGFCFGGLCMAALCSSMWERSAIKSGHAHYNATTAKFEWNEQKGQ